MAHHPGPRLGHRPALDGLRGFAVAAVVAYHLGFVRGGFLGVDVFFVLSGYLITALVLAEVDGTGRVDLRGFWSRRIRRLVPALAATVIGVLAAALALGWPRQQLRTLGIDALATLTWWANWRQAAGASYWDRGDDPFRHAWSLAIEEQFYVVWPLVVLAALALARRAGWSPRRAIGVAAGTGAVASATWMLVLSRTLDDGDLSRAYVGTDARVVAPLAGCLLACVLARPDESGGDRAGRGGRWAVPVGLVGAAILAAMVVQVDIADPALYRNGGFALAASAAVAVVWLATRVEVGERSLVAAVLANPVATHLGLRSYAIYLWSWPVQVFVAFRWPELGRGEVAAATLPLTLLLAEASHHLVEQPLRRTTGWARGRAARRPAWAAAVVVPVALVGVVLARAEPPPRHEQVSSAESAADALRPPPTVPAAPTVPPEDEPVPSDAPATTEVVPSGPQRVLLLGDSVAWTVGYYGPQDGELPEGIASIDGRGLIGCGVLAGDGWKYPARATEGPFTAPPGDSCTLQREAEDLGLAGEPDVVVVFIGAWEWIDARSPEGEVVPARSDRMAELLVEQLADRIERSHAAGARTLLAEWACPGSTVTDARGDASYIAWINGVLADAAAVARQRDGAIDVEVLGPNDEVCEGGDPAGAPTPARVAATDDEVHVANFDGGRWLWDAWLAPAVTGPDGP